MSRQVIVWEYNRVPKTELYRGHIKILTDTAKANHGDTFAIFVDDPMRTMVEAVHNFLLEYPDSMVHVTRRQPKSQFHEERESTVTLSDDLVAVLRDNLEEAYKMFEPVVVRSEESNAS